MCEPTRCVNVRTYEMCECVNLQDVGHEYSMNTQSSEKHCTSTKTGMGYKYYMNMRSS